MIAKTLPPCAFCRVGVPPFFVVVSSLAVAFWSGCAARLPEADHDLGGVTFDFERMSEEHFPDVKVEASKDCFGSWTQTGKNADGCEVISRTMTRCIPLPHAKGGKYRIACTSRVLPKQAGDVAVMIRFGTANPNFVETPYHSYVWCPLVRRPDQFRQMTKVFEARPGETHLQVTLHSANAVTELKDFAIVPEPPPPAEKGPVVVHNLFSPNFHGQFAVAAGQVGVLGFMWRLTAGAKVATAAIEFQVELPKGITYVGATFADPKAATTEMHSDGTSVTTFRGNEKVRLNEEWRWYKAGYLMVAAADLAAGGEARLKLVGKDAKGNAFEAASETIHFFAVAPVHAVQPRRFGIVSTVRDMVDWRDPAAIVRFAEFEASMGVNWLRPNPDNLTYALPTLRQHGIWRITPQDNDWLRNGNQVARDVVPVEERFVGGPWPWRNNTRLDPYLFCPLAIAGELPYFRTNSMAKVLAMLKGTDGISCNWEPQRIEGRGCVCPRCQKAFAAYLGKSVAEVAVGWPTNVMKRWHGKWAQEGERFRSLCHARAIKTMNRYVTEATGGENSCGLIPDVFFGHFASSWREQRSYPEAQEADFAADFKWFELWAPYVPWRVENEPFLRERSRGLACWAAAEDVHAQMQLDFPSPQKRPQVYGAGAGPLDGYMMQPEEIAMETYAYFFNRFGGSGAWEFPAGSDARYHRPFAEASTKIAKYEDVVWDGENVSKRVKLAPLAGYFGTDVNAVMPRWLPKATNRSQLQCAAYRKGNLTIVAAFNAWQAGEAFFLLKAELPAGEWEIVSDDGILWTKGRNALGRVRNGVNPWTSADLAKGVLLSAGACRCRVFEIRRAGADGLTAPTAEMSAERLRSIFESRKAALAAAAKADAELAKYDIYGPSKVD